MVIYRLLSRTFIIGSLLLTWTLTAYAMASGRTFDISAGAAPTTLKEFAEQAHLQLLFDFKAVKSLHTPEVKGQFEPAEALEILLRGTGLTFRRVNDRTYAILSLSNYTTLNAPAGTPYEQAGTSQSASSAQSHSGQASPPQTTAPPSASESSTTAGQGLVLQEVIVTAQKRNETVNTTPIAVTALDMNQLLESGVDQIKDLTSAVPDVQIHTIGVDSYVGITIRGISNANYQPSGNPAVSTYIDGIYIDQPVGFQDAIFDLERLEILRGPQGTLYGRNATGGNLNVVTADPKPSFGASADVSYGSYNDVMAHATVNVPVSDTLAVRAAFMEHRSDGFFDTEGTTLQNYGAADDYALRLTGLWTPSDKFRWRLSLDGFSANGTPGASIETGADGRPLNGGSPYHQPMSSDPEPVNYIRNGSVRSRMDWTLLDHLTISYIAGYQHTLWWYAWATSGQVGPPSDAAFKQYTYNVATAKSHEINVNYDGDRWKNVLGGTYYDETIGQNFYGIYPLFEFAQVTQYPYEPRDNLRDAEKRSWGVFDQTTYSLLPDLRLTAGVRYSHDFASIGDEIDLDCSPVNPATPNIVSLTYTPATPGCAIVPTPGASGSWSNVSWKGGVDYDLAANTLGYASVTTGYKQGGVQPGLPSIFPPTYKPELVTSYELGTKSQLLSHSLNVRVAAFFLNYTDLQTFQYLETAQGAFLATTNAGKSHIYGAEVESEWQASEHDYVSAFATYLHARYTVFDNAVDSRTDTPIPSLAGSQLPNAPDFSIRVAYRHEFHFANGSKLSPYAAVFWQSHSYSEPINISYYAIPAYSRSDVRLTYTNPGGNWDASAYVENLENHAIRNSDFSSGGLVFSDFGPPRTEGVRVAFRF